MKTEKENTLRYNSQEELFAMLRRCPHTGIHDMLKTMRSWAPLKAIHLDSSLRIDKNPSKFPARKITNLFLPMKNSLKSSVSESTEFKNWLKAQAADSEFDYDYTQTVYCKTRQAEKQKKNYRNASIALLVMMNILLLITMLL